MEAIQLTEQRNSAPRTAPSQRSGRRDDDRRGGRRPYQRGGSRRTKVCHFCVNKVKIIDYKDVETLRMSMSRTGRMLPRRKTGTCAKHQRIVARAIKRARHIALLPYVASHARPSSY